MLLIVFEVIFECLLSFIEMGHGPARLCTTQCHAVPRHYPTKQNETFDGHSLNQGCAGSL